MASAGSDKKMANGSRSPSLGSSPSSIPTLELQDIAGFGSLPDQWVQRAVQQGFTFNLLCIGETGIGKTTLVESLFNLKMPFPPCEQETQAVEFRSHTFDMEEGGVRLKLTVLETAGFGGQLDPRKSVKKLADHIDRQFESYLEEEMKVHRRLHYYSDTRIHACLYFISPLGHGLKALDIAALKQLHQRVNLIPIIAQADTLSKDAVARMKAKVMRDLRSNGIDIYVFPEDDDVVQETNAQLNACLPFAVVGSTDFVQKGNRAVRARQYPWGVVEVENEEHCDFVKLREAILRLNIEDLGDRTHRVLYEKYRRDRLQALGITEDDAGPQLVAKFYQMCMEEILGPLRAGERHSSERFVERVQAKEKELKDREKEIQQRLAAAKHDHAVEMAKLDEEARLLEEEMTELERNKAQASKGKKFLHL